MNVFVDANVLVAVLNKEYPAFSYAARILSLSGHSRYKIYTSPVCLAIAFYFSEKKSGNALARKKIQQLCEHVYVSETGADAVTKTIANKRVHDFEDGLEFYSAMHSNCKCIVTGDIEDFYFSEIEVLRARDFLVKYL